MAPKRRPRCGGAQRLVEAISPHAAHPRWLNDPHEGTRDVELILVARPLLRSVAVACPTFSTRPCDVRRATADIAEANAECWQFAGHEFHARAYRTQKQLRTLFRHVAQARVKCPKWFSAIRLPSLAVQPPAPAIADPDAETQVIETHTHVWHQGLY